MIKIIKPVAVCVLMSSIIMMSYGESQDPPNTLRVPLTLIDRVYYGPLYFGTPLQVNSPSVFTFDTSSSQTTVTSTHCGNCPTMYYNYSASNTSYSESQDYLYVTIGKTQSDPIVLGGEIYNDRICLDSSATVCTNSDISQFFMIESIIQNETVIPEFDGTVGMSPGGGDSQTTQLVDQFIDQDWNSIVSFRYGDDSSASSILWNGTDSNDYTGDIYYFPMQQTQDALNWTLSFQGAVFQENISESGANYALIATATPGIQLPEQDYESFVSQLQDNFSDQLNCTHTPCLLTDSCSSYYSELPDLSLTLNQTQFIIPPAGYLVNQSYVYGNYTYSCEFAIYRNTYNNEYILGTTFLRNFYLTLNYLNPYYSAAPIGLAVNAGAPSGTQIFLPASDTNSQLPGWAIALIVITSIFLLVLTACMIKKIRDDKKAKQVQEAKAILEGQFSNSDPNEAIKPLTQNDNDNNSNTF